MTKKMECGCTIEWPHQNNHAEQGVARRQHRETCALYAAIHQLRKARENVKMIESNIAYLRRVKDAGGEAAYTQRQIRILDAMAEG